MILRWPWRRVEQSILMVCRANVCRSPMAEALLRHKLKQAGLHGRVSAASAGIGAIGGQAMDPRARQVLQACNVVPGRHRSRPLKADDCQRHDLVLAMDREVLHMLEKQCPAPLQHKLQLVTHWSTTFEDQDVPDPYYGNLPGFERVLGMLDEALDGLLQRALQ
jgi:protein-tyrosine phosphatase